MNKDAFNYGNYIKVRRCDINANENVSIHQSLNEFDVRNNRQNNKLKTATTEVQFPD